MKINWKLRLKNPATLISLITIVVSTIYQILSVFQIVPKISENEVLQLATLIINILAGLGILVDPTTKGLSDSERAMGYDNLG